MIRPHARRIAEIPRKISPTEISPRSNALSKSHEWIQYTKSIGLNLDETRRAPARGDPPRLVDNRVGSLDNEALLRRPVNMALQDRILQQIQCDPSSASDSAFNAVALELFAYQFACSPPYRRLCEAAGRDPSKVSSWKEIPAVPVTAFKWMTVSCRPAEEAAQIFRSSGTRRGGQHRSSHFLFDLELAESAILASFQRHVLPEAERMQMFILTPSPDELPDSSLAFMMEAVRRKFGGPGSDYFLRAGRLESNRLIAALKQSIRPVLLLGTSFSFVHFLDDLENRGIRLRLPAGSRLMDTGGFKGRSREVPREEIYRLCERGIGIPEPFCVNEYGMSELSSQFYDKVAGKESARGFIPPPQVRTELFDAGTLLPAGEGEIGLLCHYDLANMDSAMAVLTEDLGRRSGKGFELIGRAPEAETRGCSLLIDALLQGAP